MENSRTIEVLNTLLEINNDRIEGYETASEETKDNKLKSLFSGFIQTSQKCKRELVNEVMKLGGTPTEGTTTTGKFFRVWMDVKAALATNDRKVILNSCEYGEEKAVETYDDVVTGKMEHLNAHQQTMVANQRSLIITDFNQIKSLADRLSVEV
jgi:uncharacterized protein (TIGR02284 family)